MPRKDVFSAKLLVNIQAPCLLSDVWTRAHPGSRRAGGELIGVGKGGGIEGRERGGRVEASDFTCCWSVGSGYPFGLRDTRTGTEREGGKGRQAGRRVST